MRKFYFCVYGMKTSHFILSAVSEGNTKIPWIILWIVLFQLDFNDKKQQLHQTTTRTINSPCAKYIKRKLFGKKNIVVSLPWPYTSLRNGSSIQVALPNEFRHCSDTECGQGYNTRVHPLLNQGCPSLSWYGLGCAIFVDSLLDLRQHNWSPSSVVRASPKQLHP